MIKFEPTEPLTLNYANLYILPINNGEYAALFGDAQYIFTAEEIDELCDKVGCTSFQLSKSELVKMIKEIYLYGSNNN